MSFAKRARPAKIELRCYCCKVVCAAKNGDWRPSPVKGIHQVFLCKDCEKAGKLASVARTAAIQP